MVGVPETLRYAAARLVLGCLNGTSVQAVTHDLMDAGIYSDHFLPIVDARSPASMVEVDVPFRKALEELGVPLPSHEEAVCVILDRHTLRIVERKVEPFVGLSDLFADLPYDERSNDASVFQFLYFEWDDGYRNNHLRALADETVATARKWRAQYAGKFARDDTE